MLKKPLTTATAGELAITGAISASLSALNLGSFAERRSVHLQTSKLSLRLREPNAGHVGVDVIVGHLVQVLRSNIDPAKCPW
jgi:hypothetical protein